MEDLLFPEIIIKKLSSLKEISKKNNYEKIINPLNEILEFYKSIYNFDLQDVSEEVNLEKDKIEILAYYLSRYDHYDIFPSLNQNDALKKMSEIINVKPSTLRIIRDRFDSKMIKIKSKESPYLKIRKGINLPLSKKEEKIFEYYKNKKRAFIFKDVIKLFEIQKKGA